MAWGVYFFMKCIEGKFVIEKRLIKVGTLFPLFNILGF